MNSIMPAPIGEIKIIEVFEYIDFPVIFSCENSLEQVYIVVWIDTNPNNDSWFFIPVSRTRLSSIKTGNISLRDSITHAESGWLYQVDIPTDIDCEVSLNLKYTSEIAEDQLPDPDSFFSIPDTTLPQLENPLINAPRSNRDVLDISLNIGDTHSNEIASTQLATVLQITQSLINSFSLRTESRDRETQAFNSAHEMQVTDIYAASFGIRLKSKNIGNLMGECSTSQAIENLLKLISSTANPDSLKDQFRNLDRRTLKFYQHLLKRLLSEDIEATFEWASPSKKHMATSLSKISITNALSIMDDEASDVDEVRIIGKLVGVNTQRHKFTLITEENESITGKVSNDFYEYKFTVPVQVSAMVRKKFDYNALTGEEHTTYTLIDLEEIASK